MIIFKVAQIKARHFVMELPARIIVGGHNDNHDVIHPR